MNGQGSKQRDWSELIAHVNDSAFYRLLGFRAVHVEEGLARLRMPVANSLMQFQGAMHGGAIYSIADAAVAVALLTLCQPGEKVLTIEGKLNYLAPITADMDGEVEAIGRIVHKGRSISLGEVEVLRPDGRRAALGLITYTVRT